MAAVPSPSPWRPPWGGDCAKCPGALPTDGHPGDNEVWAEAELFLNAGSEVRKVVSFVSLVVCMHRAVLNLDGQAGGLFLFALFLLAPLGPGGGGEGGSFGEQLVGTLNHFEVRLMVRGLGFLDARASLSAAAVVPPSYSSSSSYGLAATEKRWHALLSFRQDGGLLVVQVRSQT